MPDWPGSKQRFALYRDDELAALPAPRWIIEGVLPANALCVLVGKAATLKTFLALDITAHVELGLEWHGRRTWPGRTLYVYAEGRTGLSARVEAWKKYNHVDTLGALFLPQRVTLNDLADVSDLLATIDAKCLTQSMDLIVVDTLNRNSTGNENSTEDMSAVVRGCDRLREATGATVLLVHHSGHTADDRGRGSSVLHNAADTVMMAARDEDRLTVECTKQKDSEEFTPIAFEALPAGGSLVLKPIGLTSGELKGKRRALLVVLQEQSNDDGLSHRSWMDQSGVPASTFNHALNWLKANRFVVNQRGKWKLSDAAHLALNSSAVQSVQCPSNDPIGPSRSVQSNMGVCIHTHPLD